MKRFPLLTNTRQSTVYSCGAAALQAVLSYWGKDLEEQELMKLLNTSPETGTYVGDIVRVARELGFSAEVKENLTLNDLHTALDKGIPVIICGQAWRSQEDSDKSAREDWEDGHYIVVLGMDKKYVYYQDPFIRRGKGFVSHQFFEDSWHNVRGKTASDKKEQMHLGVFISGDKPPRHHPLVTVDVSGSDLAKFGPLQLVNVRFDSRIFPYDVLGKMNAILNRDLIRPIAYVVLIKDQDGNVGVLEGGDIAEDEAVEIDAVIGHLIGLGVGGPDIAKEYAGIVGKRAAENTFGFSEKDLQGIAEALLPDRSALIFILEHIWIKKIKEVLSSYGGSVVSYGMIDAEMLIRWGARLQGAGKGNPETKFTPEEFLKGINKKE
jgi:predicted double-glycine peptidase